MGLTPAAGGLADEEAGMTTGTVEDPWLGIPE